MTSASHPRFRLLIGWCCLMTSALLIITVYLAGTRWREKSQTSTTGSEETNSTERTLIFPFSSSDSKEIWICHPCKSSSFSLKNSTVEITVSGLYYFHAQVTFQNVNKMSDLATVTLHKYKGPGTQERILSKVKHYGPGTATMICLVELKNGDSISLEIDPINNISRQDSDTYWEIIFLNNK
uniref:Lymphotoxin alpha (TNF superfamily, member 1) n=1 Tax=Sinocyclocheilus anshuiensis TaxID=1608454 RepID=A0A671MX08_9TELE